jgi:hypothetical protein
MLPDCVGIPRSEALLGLLFIRRTLSRTVAQGYPEGMATYRIMESSHERQFGLPAEAATMASMFEPVEFILRNESAGSLDL